MDFPQPLDLGQLSYGSGSLAWRDFDKAAALVNPEYGYYKLERFDSWVDLTSAASNAQATLTQATAGTASVVDGPATVTGAPIANFGAMLEVDSASSTVTQGANLQFTKQRVLAKPNTLIILGALMRAHDIATGLEFLFGMSNSDTTLIASSAVTTGYRYGFSSVTNDKIVKAFSGNNAVPTLATGTAHTFIDADVTTDGTEWVKFETRYHVGKYLEWYVNGVKFGSDLASTTWPSGASAVLVPSIVVQVETTNIDALVRIPWIEFGYKTQ